MVSHDEHFDLGVLEQLCASPSFFFEGESSEVVIDGDSVEEGCGILVDGGELWLGERCEDCCVDGMDVHGAFCVRECLMDGCVQSPGGWVWGVGLGECIGIFGVEEEEVGGFDSCEVPLVGVDEELGCGVSYTEGEVVCYGFVHVESCCPAEGAGELRSFGVEGEVGGVGGGGGEGGHGRHGATPLR